MAGVKTHMREHVLNDIYHGILEEYNKGKLYTPTQYARVSKYSYEITYKACTRLYTLGMINYDYHAAKEKIDNTKGYMIPKKMKISVDTV